MLGEMPRVEDLKFEGDGQAVERFPSLFPQAELAVPARAQGRSGSSRRELAARPVFAFLITISCIVVSGLEIAVVLHWIRDNEWQPRQESWFCSLYRLEGCVFSETNV